MSIRRLHSLSLVDGDVNPHQLVASGTSESPSTHAGKLPSLWKSFKAKLGSLTTSRSSTSLSTMATDDPSRPASPGASPPVQALDSSVHSNSGLSITSRRFFAKVSHNQPSPGELNTCRSVPAVTGSSALPIRSPRAPSPGCEVGNSLQMPASPNAQPSATVMPSAASGTVQQPPPQQQQQPIAVAVEPSETTNGSSTTGAGGGGGGGGSMLLSVSSALPAAMRRPVWSLEDYAVSKRLYKGGSSAVYKATCRRSGIAVALKVYFLSRVPVNVVHMLKREIEIHAQLVHKHIARLYGAFMDGNERVVLVQEFAAQGDLFGIMQRLGGRMQAEQAAGAVILPFLDALNYLHSKGVCHRDIKPENILFTTNWRLLLADFGVSINLGQERAVTRAGTEGYMAPEVERCPLKSDPAENKDNPHYAYSTAVDIWAVGVLAYELLVGFPPVVAMPHAPKQGTNASAADTVMNDFVQNEMTAAALHFPASVPPAARSFVLSALATDPRERPTAAQLMQHPWLQAAAAEAAPTPPRTPAAEQAEAGPTDVRVNALCRVQQQPAVEAAAATAAAKGQRQQREDE
ncbi:hypothetical protein Agub_g9597 [Astrephomene gubernaculifera]|uniref:Protein kinase domain-containing protein n=1 Tax=Astrephomene gubernaculifera TaxID=47775 RepID=A0AAD3DTI6_9CHLO|nr:hypothetical protein Agub_g9597 [Astrephomene gubernaculifera]